MNTWIDVAIISVVGGVVIIGTIHFIIMRYKANAVLEIYHPSQDLSRDYTWDLKLSQ